MGVAKKKWTAKGRSKDRIANKIVMDEETYKRLLSEVPKYKLSTVAIVSERLKVNGSVARASLQLLADKGLIVPVSRHHQQVIYKPAVVAVVEKAEADE